MYTLPEIVANLFPNKSLEEQQAILDRFQVGGWDYCLESWQEVKKEDLTKEDTKMRLARTLYQLEWGYDGVAGEIMGKLEEWSDGTLVFLDFSEEDQEFYQRFYTFIGFLCFDNLDLVRQSFLLNGSFIVRAVLWQVPVYMFVQMYFAHWLSIEESKKDAEAFAFNLANNQFILEDPGKTNRTVAEWIKIFAEFEIGEEEDKAVAFMAERIEVQRLDIEVKRVLGIIIKLYDDLTTGKIYLDLDYDLGAHRRLETRQGLNLEEEYIKVLYSLDKEKIAQWLEDYQGFVDWVGEENKSIKFIEKVLLILDQKADLSDQGQVNNILNLLAGLKNVGFENIDEVFYFDESKGKFVWDEEFFASSQSEEPAESEPEPEEPPENIPSPGGQLQ